MSYVKVIILGATGMVGQGVLRECLLDPEVEKVVAIGRNATAQRHEKLHDIVHNDLSDLSAWGIRAKVNAIPVGRGTVMFVYRNGIQLGAECFPQVSRRRR